MQATDLIAAIVAKGHGVISCGRGIMVVYGAKCPEKRGVVFVSNTLHDEEAEAMICEAVQIAGGIVRNPKAKPTDDRREMPSEE